MIAEGTMVSTVKKSRNGSRRPPRPFIAADDSRGRAPRERVRALPYDGPVPGPHPADPLDWRPQMPRDKMRPSAIADPILEPHWSGRRVLVHFDLERPTADGGPWLRLIAADGGDPTDAEPPGSPH